MSKLPATVPLDNSLMARFRRVMQRRKIRFLRINPDKYAHLVEYGHGGPSPAAAHPFLRPARDRNRVPAANAIAAKARERLIVVVKKEAQRAQAKRRKS